MPCACCSENDVEEQNLQQKDIPNQNFSKEGASKKVRFLIIRFVLSALLFTAGIVFGFFYSYIAVSRGFFVAAWIISGYTVLYVAAKNILKGDFFDENFLMSIATIGAFAIGQWSEGAAVMLFYNIGELIQESAVHRSRRSIRDLVDVRPETARIAKTDIIIPAEDVSLGEILRVLPGEKIPLDAVVIEGHSSLNTASLTGESVPREVEKGAEVLAGFVNGGGLLIIRTTALYGETAASKMLSLIESAQTRKAKAEKLITSFARVYTPIVTFAALFLAVIPPLFLVLTGIENLSGWISFEPWIGRALVFLVISCPCAFVISVPLGFFGGIGGAAHLGILVKGADYLDVLAKAETVVFDKTGTLTEGQFSVTGLFPSLGVSEKTLIEYAIAAETYSNHPVAMAIKQYAHIHGYEGSSKHISDYSERPGHGLTLNLDGVPVLAGSIRFLESEKVQGLPAEREKTNQGGGTRVEIAQNGIWLGSLVLTDAIKTDAGRAIEELKDLGVRHIVLLTGDSELVAQQTASMLGIQEYYAGVLPHEKVERFEEIAGRTRKNRTTIFVGDGINDAPVLALSDVGIAMGGIGSDAAVEAADVVLMNDNPLLVATAIKSARWTRHIVMINILLAFSIKIGFLILGAFGFATLWEAIFADVGVALLATLNSLRARKVPGLH
ncbi:MAG TPA: heavy metal translocating P-type ATPase [Treponemataceae bacterium]|nr:heavy metal translocating P-type ATPase [Treponemataceae bacterium]